MPVVFNPVITAAGKAAALAASNDGLELELTHISFGIGEGYDPVGDEVALVDQAVLLTIGSGSRVTPTQIRVSAVWKAATGTYPITEVAIWAGTTLFAIWSSATEGETPIAIKTPGVDFVFFYDLKLDALPAGSVTVLADDGQSAILSALGDHTNDQDAHPQYLRRDKVAQEASTLLWAGEAGGTADALELALPPDTVLTAYAAGQRYAFIAAADNTGAVTVDIEELGAVAVTKVGATPLVAGDIVGGAIYELLYDGTQFQIAGGIGGGNSFFTLATATMGEAENSIDIDYTVGAVAVYKNGRLLPAADFTATDGETVVVPSAVEGDEISAIAFETFTVANTYTKPQIDAMLNDVIVGAGLQASETVMGNAELATQGEVDAGTDDERIVTPLKLATHFGGAAGRATEEKQGTAELATQAEVTTGTDDQRIVTPLKLKTHLEGGDGQATQTKRGTAEIATQAEVTAGADDERIVTPLKLKTHIEGANGQATETKRGTAEIASQAETNSGTDDERIVTPQKLRAYIEGSAAQATTGKRGTMSLATGTEARALSSSSKAITPATLAAAFSGEKFNGGTTNGYQIFPSGLCFQWGTVGLRQNHGGGFTVVDLHIPMQFTINVQVTRIGAAMLEYNDLSIGTRSSTLFIINHNPNLNGGEQVMWFAVGVVEL